MKRLPLTPRQIEILQLYAEGFERDEVAQILGISRETIRSHLDNISLRLGTHKTYHAVAVAMRHGFVS